MEENLQSKKKETPARLKQARRIVINSNEVKDG